MELAFACRAFAEEAGRDRSGPQFLVGKRRPNGQRHTACNDRVAAEEARLAEEAGERMEETRETTQSLVESVVRIARSATTQAKLAEGLRTRAGNINEFTRATNTEMQAQVKLSERLVGAADELQRSISVFKLQDDAEENVLLIEKPAEDTAETV